MNEEEIINKINEIIEYSKLSTDIGFADQTDKINAIEGLLDLYEKEKEENKALYDKGYKEGYVKGVQPQIFDNWEKSNAKMIEIKSNYISKDKIEEKIEELYNRDWIFNDVRDRIIEVLQELLEE